MLTFFLLFGVATLHEKRSETHLSKEEANHNHFKGRRKYYSTPFARTRIIMSFNFGNDGATQFQGGGYGCVNCLLFFLSLFSSCMRTRDDARVFGNIFEYIFE